MFKLVGIAFLLFMGAFAYSCVSPDRAACATCLGHCFSSAQCYPGCTCLSVGPGAGRCVSLQ